MLNPRTSLHLAVLASGLALSSLRSQIAPVIGKPFPRWSAGVLDIHQISTGRGNSAFFIFPDSTTLLLDAGDAGPIFRKAPAYPNDSRSTAEWITRYVRRYQPRPAPLDYAVITHLHIDHIGALSADARDTLNSGYRLTGITDVATRLGVATLLDRGWPHYDYPAPASDSETINYRRFADSLSRRGALVLRFEPGSAAQIRSRHSPGAFPRFEVRNIIANGEVWSGQGESVIKLFPALSALPDSLLPNENMCSVGFRISYGSFKYLTSGDIPGLLPGPIWRDLEGPVARVVGHVDVQVANHHAGSDAESNGMLDLLLPTVVVIPGWAPIHPAADALERLATPRSGKRPLIFTTDFRDEAPGKPRPGRDQLAAPPGHVIIRVEPGGRRFWVAVVTNGDESGRVIGVSGPFVSDGVPSAGRE